MDYFIGYLTTNRDGSSAVRQIGNYQSLEDAVKAAQTLIDHFLLSKHQPGMTEDDLFSIYKNDCEIPVIFNSSDDTINAGTFNPFQYATLKCGEICK